MDLTLTIFNKSHVKQMILVTLEDDRHINLATLTKLSLCKMSTT